MKKYLIIGLGSMGKRRIRCLKRMGISSENIIGIDVRDDRCKEAKEKYDISVVKDEKEVDFSEIEAVIVSLPPDRHFLGVEIAFKNRKPVFVEASVVLEDVKKIKENNKQNIFVAPSCTFTYHPMIKQIKEIVKSGKYGKVCNFSYHSGQYLPDWHPWETVNDYYVGNRETGGAREIVPFELTWIVDTLGLPKAIKGYYRKTTDLGCDIEDSYVCAIDYEDMVGSLLVDVVGRNSARNLIINFEEAQLQWRWDNRKIEIYEAATGAWTYINQNDEIHEAGYNVNIGENMYIEELSAFLRGIENRTEYPNTIEKDIEILQLLNDLERSDKEYHLR